MVAAWLLSAIAGMCGDSSRCLAWIRLRSRPDVLCWGCPAATLTVFSRKCQLWCILTAVAEAEVDDQGLFAASVLATPAATRSRLRSGSRADSLSAHGGGVSQQQNRSGIPARANVLSVRSRLRL